MAKYRADGPEFAATRWCDLGGTQLVKVEPGDVVDVPEAHLAGHTMQDSLWTPVVDGDKKNAKASAPAEPDQEV